MKEEIPLLDPDRVIVKHLKKVQTFCLLLQLELWTNPEMKLVQRKARRFRRESTAIQVVNRPRCKTFSTEIRDSVSMVTQAVNQSKGDISNETPHQTTPTYFAWKSVSLICLTFNVFRLHFYWLMILCWLNRESLLKWMSFQKVLNDLYYSALSYC